MIILLFRVVLHLAEWVVCGLLSVPSLGHVDDAEQRHVDNGDFVLVTAALAAGGGVEAVRLILTESEMSSYQFAKK